MTDFIEKSKSKSEYDQFMGRNSEMTRLALKQDLTPTELGFYLYVDTTQKLAIYKRPIWASYLFNTVYSWDEINAVDDTLVKYVMAYPVFLINESETLTREITLQDGSLEMICEVKNENNEWQAIEYWSSSWCGNSYYTYSLPPKHVMYTKVMPFKGKNTTTAGLKLSSGFGTVYSNEFIISVNPSQFLASEK